MVKRNATSIRISKSGKVSKGKEVGGEVMYYLKKSVTQRPDESVLPAENQIQQAAITQAETYLDRATRRNL